MKNHFTILLTLLVSTCFAQFDISGTIKNYEEKPLIIKTMRGASPEYYTKVVTDKNGSFDIKIDYDYSGLLYLETTKGMLELIADNKPIQVELDINNPQNTMQFEDAINATYIAYLNYADKKKVQTEMLPVIKRFYSPEDEFYQDIKKEEDRIKGLQSINLQKFPSLEYFITNRELLDSFNAKDASLEKIKEQSKNHILNDLPYISQFNLLNSYVTSYVSASVGKASSREEASKNIEKALDEMLLELQPETPRGQEVLSILIPFLENNTFTKLADKYKKQAQSLTCEISPELKKIIDPAKALQIGDTVPNFDLQQNPKGYDNLYDVKAEKKLILFWASWCPHCMDEIPFVKEFYKQFKKEGGEIIAFSLDMDDSYKKVVKDVDWINTTDHLKWDSPTVDAYRVNATPTFFMVDKNNKIISKGSNIKTFQ